MMVQAGNAMWFSLSVGTFDESAKFGRAKAWLAGHTDWLAWLFSLSLIVFLASLLVVPWIVVRLPADYFTIAKATRNQERESVSEPAWRRHPVLRMMLMVAKNFFGAILFFAGLAMLVLPGQGLLTLFVSLMLLDFPGKKRLERAIVSRPAILKPINWVRARKHRPPLEI